MASNYIWYVIMNEVNEAGSLVSANGAASASQRHRGTATHGHTASLTQTALLRWRHRPCPLRLPLKHLVVVNLCTVTYLTPTSEPDFSICYGNTLLCYFFLSINIVDFFSCLKVSDFFDFSKWRLKELFCLFVFVFWLMESEVLRTNTEVSNFGIY